MSVTSLKRLPRPMPSDGQASRYDAMVRPDGMVHRTLFTDPAIFEKEMLNIFGGTWVFLLHETEIPNVNDFKCVNIGRRPVIVTRDADGEIRGLMNRRTHRGTVICVDSHGNAKRFQCAYHGWTFSNAGELTTVTFADGYGPGFDKAAHNLGRFPLIASYRGYVFGSLDPDVEPLEDWMGPASALIGWSVDKLCPRQARAWYAPVPWCSRPTGSCKTTTTGTCTTFRLRTARLARSRPCGTARVRGWTTFAATRPPCASSITGVATS